MQRHLNTRIEASQTFQVQIMNNNRNMNTTSKALQEFSISQWDIYLNYDGNVVFNVQINNFNFLNLGMMTMMPHVDGEGHAHVHIFSPGEMLSNSNKIGRYYGGDYILTPEETSMEFIVALQLNTNMHIPYVYENNTVVFAKHVTLQNNKIIANDYTIIHPNIYVDYIASVMMMLPMNNTITIPVIYHGFSNLYPKAAIYSKNQNIVSQNMLEILRVEHQSYLKISLGENYQIPEYMLHTELEVRGRYSLCIF